VLRSRAAAVDTNHHSERAPPDAPRRRARTARDRSRLRAVVVAAARRGAARDAIGDLNPPRQGAHGIVLVYDVTDRDTFASISDWFEQIKLRAEARVTLTLVGNKCDNASKRVVQVRAVGRRAAFGLDSVVGVGVLAERHQWCATDEAALGAPRRRGDWWGGSRRRLPSAAVPGFARALLSRARPSHRAGRSASSFVVSLPLSSFAELETPRGRARERRRVAPSLRDVVVRFHATQQHHAR